MTQEDKELLLKDLCARLPYSLKVKRPDNGSIDYVSTINVDAGTLTVLYNGYETDIEKFIPFLRPMSSMTEEELFERCKLSEHDYYGLIDWLNKHHFDYRNLIEKGLALEATEEMYKIVRVMKNLPDKIYLATTEEIQNLDNSFVGIAHRNPKDIIEPIEYIRKDAFIEKAVKYIANHFLAPGMDNEIKDFVNYMKRD